MIDFETRTKSAAIWLTGPAHSSRTLTTRVAVQPNAQCSAFGRRFFFPWEEMAMAKINGTCVGESLVGEGNEVAHIDLIMGPRGSAVEAAFTHALTNNKDGFTSLLAVVAPNLAAKPNTILFNKVTIKGAKQAVQMFGPAQRAVAMAVADCVEDGTIPANEADDIFICVGVFIHWLAEDDKKIQDYNHAATKESTKRSVAREPKPPPAVAK